MFELQWLPWVRPGTAAKRREKSFRAGRLLDRNRNPRLSSRLARTAGANVYLFLWKQA